MNAETTPEDGLAKRIEQLRTEAGWSYSELSRRMGEVGCPIERSSLQKIEKGSPRRKIGVNELIAFTTVFDKTFAEILLTPSEVARTAYKRDVTNIRSTSLAKIEADRRYEELIERLVEAALDEEWGSEHRGQLEDMRQHAEETTGADDSITHPLLNEVLRRVAERTEEE